MNSENLEFNLGIEPPVVEEMPGVSCRTLESDQMMSLALMELASLTERSAISLFRQSARPDFSFVALREGRPVGFCLVIEVLDRALEITHVSGDEPEVERLVVQSSLLALWENERTRVTYHQAGQRECLGQVGFNGTIERGRFAVAKCYLNMGALEEAQDLYPNGEPENLTFFRNQRSPNRLFWLDMDDFQGQSEGTVVTLTRRHILASAPLLFESFGNDSDWIKGFLPEALLECCVGVVQDEKILAACMVGSEEFPSIWAITVDKNLRQQGWGSRLLSHSLQRLKQGGHRTVVAHVREANIASTRLFQKLGFQRIDTTSDLIQLGKTAGGLKQNCTHYLLNEDAATAKEACLLAGVKFVG